MRRDPKTGRWHSEDPSSHPGGATQTESAIWSPGGSPGGTGDPKVPRKVQESTRTTSKGYATESRPPRGRLRLSGESVWDPTNPVGPSGRRPPRRRETNGEDLRRRRSTPGRMCRVGGGGKWTLRRNSWRSTETLTSGPGGVGPQVVLDLVRLGTSKCTPETPVTPRRQWRSGRTARNLVQ